MNTTRPVNLDLTKYKFPVMAIVSILHRISGVVIFLGLPLLLYVLHESLASQNRFLALSSLFSHCWFELLIWAIFAAVIFHLIAGIRHLLMDLGFAESYRAGKTTARLVILCAIVLIILAGVWLLW